MSIKDIARSLGIPEATVKTRLHNGRETIRTKIMEIEKRDGIRLHGIAPIVFFLFLFHKMDAMAMEPDKQMLADILDASAVSIKAASLTAGKSAAAKSAGSAAAKGIAGKVIAGIAAVAVIGGGAFYGISHLTGSDIPDSVPVPAAESTQLNDNEKETQHILPQWTPTAPCCRLWTMNRAPYCNVPTW